jgi:hypothetical protein
MNKKTNMHVTEITRDQLSRNFDTHLKNITNEQKIVVPDFMDQFMQLDVTHTFAEIDRDGCSLFQNIFFNSNENHRGLLSYQYRENNGLPNSRDPSGDAALFGLYEFVYAYLGSHEPYYGGGDIDPAFGVFLSKELERTISSNASRRDLASPEIRPPVENEFMIPEDARKIIVFEIVNGYHGDIWHYWGNPNADYADADYLKNMWKKKAEMHFFDSVQISDINGIIWPHKRVWTVNGFDDSQRTEKQRQFVELYPNIRIYNYQWNPESGSKAFLNASYRVSQYLFEHNEYPENCNFE